MSTFEPIRLSIEEITRYGQSILVAPQKPRTLIFVADAAEREEMVNRLSQAVEGLPIVVERSDPAVAVAGESKREFIQGVFSRDARGAGAVHAFVTTDAEFLHRINAIPAIERSAYYDLRQHMA